jgi:hypothetical protein
VLLVPGCEGWSTKAVPCRMRPVVRDSSSGGTGRELLELVVITGGLLGNDAEDKLPERSWDADLWEEINKRRVESS